MQLKKIRRKARIDSLQILYCCEICQINPSEVLNGNHQIPNTDDFIEYTNTLVTGTYKDCKKIDDKINSISHNWIVDRMPICDRCLLRQTIYEMFNIEDVPVSVSINEAVEIAKIFGGDDESSKFINGILGKIANKFSLE